MGSICQAGAARWTTIEALRLASVALEYLGAGVDTPGVSDDQRSVLSFQEGCADPTRSDDEVPQTIEPLDDDFHVTVLEHSAIEQILLVTAVLRLMIVIAGVKFPDTARTRCKTTATTMSCLRPATLRAGSHHSRLSDIIFRAHEVVLKQSRPNYER